MFLLTGGGSGIGRALALSLAERGKQVLIVGRRQQALLETAQQSSLIDFVCADVTKDIGRARIVDKLKSFAQIEGIIHNAGVIDPIIPMAEISEAAWGNIIAANLNAPLFLTQALLTKLVNGRVLNIGSGAAYFPVAGWAAYCVSKAALAMLTRCWQLESKETAFASVMPGIIDTDMQEKIRQASFMDSDKQDFFKTLQQENKLLNTNTVAAFLTWLLLDVDKQEFVAREWDIYEVWHHPSWLAAPHSVPHWQ